MTIPYSLTKTALAVSLLVSSVGVYAAEDINLNYKTGPSARTTPSDLALQARACHSPVDPLEIILQLDNVNTRNLKVEILAKGDTTNKQFDIFPGEKDPKTNAVIDQKESFKVPFTEIKEESVFNYSGAGVANTPSTTTFKKSGTAGLFWPPYDQTYRDPNDVEVGTVCFFRTNNRNSDQVVTLPSLNLSSSGLGQLVHHYHVLYKYKVGTWSERDPVRADDNKLQVGGKRIRDLIRNVDIDYNVWEKNCKAGVRYGGDIVDILAVGASRNVIVDANAARDDKTSYKLPPGVSINRGGDDKVALKDTHYTYPGDVITNWWKGDDPRTMQKLRTHITTRLYRMKPKFLDRTFRGLSATGNITPDTNDGSTIRNIFQFQAPELSTAKNKYDSKYKYNRITGTYKIKLSNRNINHLEIKVTTPDGRQGKIFTWTRPEATGTSSPSGALMLKEQKTMGNNFRNGSYAEDVFSSLYKPSINSVFRGALLSATHFKDPTKLANYQENVALSKPAAKDGDLNLLNMEKLVVHIKEDRGNKPILDGDWEDLAFGDKSKTPPSIETPTGKIALSVYAEPLKFMPLTKNGNVIMTAEAVRDACYVQQLQ